MLAPTSSKEETYRLWELLSQLMTADRPIEESIEDIDELIRHSEFQSRGKKICGSLMYRYRDLMRRYYSASYDAEDLFAEACERMFERADRISPEKTKDLGAFFDWFFILARNIVFSKLRKFKRLPEEIFFVSIEDLSLANQQARPDLERAREQVLEFIETLPGNRRRAVRLWYEGYSTREIEKILGHVRTNVTIQNWVSAALEAFRKPADRGDV